MEEKTHNVECIGFIMDGNRRWAKEQHLPTLVGHRKGAETLENVIKWICDAKIPHAVFYVFSSENWNRGEEEVEYLMNLLKEYVEKLRDKLQDTRNEEEKVYIRFIGERDRLDSELVKGIERLEKESKQYSHTTIWIALSYGGRNEIIDAVNSAVQNGEEVTEESFSTLLSTAEMPDPDIIVRTSGERRLSNFLPWQSVYSELFFTDTYWPDFSKEEFHNILENYGSRSRRKGK